MIPEIDPSTPLAELLKEHGDKFLPLLPPLFRNMVNGYAARGLTLAQARASAGDAVLRELVGRAPEEHRAFVAHLLGVKV